MYMLNCHDNPPAFWGAQYVIAHTTFPKRTEGITFTLYSINYMVFKITIIIILSFSISTIMCVTDANGLFINAMRNKFSCLLKHMWPDTGIMTHDPSARPGTCCIHVRAQSIPKRSQPLHVHVELATFWRQSTNFIPYQ